MDVINKGYLGTKIAETKGHISFLEKTYEQIQREKKNDKLIGNALKATMQVLYDEKFYDDLENPDEALRFFSSFVDERQKVYRGLPPGTP